MSGFASFTKLIVTGSREELTEIRAFTHGCDAWLRDELRPNLFSFEKLVPILPKLKNKQNFMELKKLMVSFWGTASSACGTSLKEEYNRLTYRFATIDGHPTEIIKTLVKAFPKLKFEYICDFPPKDLRIYGKTNKGQFLIHTSQIGRDKFMPMIYR